MLAAIDRHAKGEKKEAAEKAAVTVTVTMSAQCSAAPRASAAPAAAGEATAKETSPANASAAEGAAAPKGSASEATPAAAGGAGAVRTQLEPSHTPETNAPQEGAAGGRAGEAGLTTIVNTLNGRSSTMIATLAASSSLMPTLGEAGTQGNSAAAAQEGAPKASSGASEGGASTGGASEGGAKVSYVLDSVCFTC